MPAYIFWQHYFRQPIALLNQIHQTQLIIRSQQTKSKPKETQPNHANKLCSKQFGVATRDSVKA